MPWPRREIPPSQGNRTSKRLEGNALTPLALRGKRQRAHTRACWPQMLALGPHPWPSALSGSERHATEIADMPGSRSARGHSRPLSGGGSGPRADRRVWISDTPAVGSRGLAVDAERRAGATAAARVQVFLGLPEQQLRAGPGLEDLGAFVQQVRPRGGHLARCTECHLHDGGQGPARGGATSYTGLRGHPRRDTCGKG